MGYEKIRSTLMDFFEENIDLIQTMYREAPWLLQGRQFKMTPGTTSAMVGMVHIDSSSERRIALPWKYGQKMVTYQCSLLCLFQYMKPHQLDPGKTEDDWVVTLDDTIDQIKTVLRSNPNAGDATAIFQMEGMSDQVEHFTVEQDLPIDDGARIWELLRVVFPVYEIIQA